MNESPSPRVFRSTHCKFCINCALPDCGQCWISSIYSEVLLLGKGACTERPCLAPEELPRTMFPDMEPSLRMLARIQLTEPRVSPFKLKGGMLLDYRCSICNVLPHPRCSTCSDLYDHYGATIIWQNSRNSARPSPSVLSAPPSTEVETWPGMWVRFMTEWSSSFLSNTISP